MPYHVQLVHGKTSAGELLLTYSALDLDSRVTCRSDPKGTPVAIIPGGSKLGISVNQSFSQSSDFTFDLNYLGWQVKDLPLQVMTVGVSGLADAINSTTANKEDYSINVPIVMDHSGLLSVPAATVTFKALPHEADSLAGKLKGLFGSGTAKSNSSDVNATDSAEQVKESSPPSDQQVALKVDIIYPSVKPLSFNETRTSRNKLQSMDLAETRKKTRDEARNGLEGYLYRVRDVLASSYFIEASKQHERRAIEDKLDTLTKWLGEDGDKAETSELKLKKTGLE